MPDGYVSDEQYDDLLNRFNYHPPQDDEILNRFNYHPPQDDETRQAHEYVRKSLLSATTNIVRRIPDGREQSLFITKMEEAMFWANAAIARSHK